LTGGPPRFFCPLTLTACRPTDRGPPSAPTDQPDRPLMVYIPGLDGAGIGACSQFDGLGWAVQVDPIKSKLTPPETKRLKLKCDILLSTSAFKFNLRR